MDTFQKYSKGEAKSNKTELVYNKCEGTYHLPHWLG